MTLDKPCEGPSRASDITHDAVVVIPGIMGSELVETATGTVLWGLSPKAFLSAWTSGSSLQRLHLCEQEREGRYGQITASRLLRFPAWLPFLQGIEPYTELVTRLQQVVAHPAAVLEFPYDWRLPVSYNAGRLAEKAIRHLEAWWQHPAHQQARRAHPTGRQAKLILVAHSMGGLLARQLTAISGVSEHVRATITLGTPFHGAPKAALILNTGTGTPVPLPARRPAAKLFARNPDHGVRALACTLPGIYDLLPTYTCVEDPSVKKSDAEDGHVARRLEVADVVALGGDADLETASRAARTTAAALPIPGHELVLGKAQPTVQGITLADGVAKPVYTELHNRPGGKMGDGTVPTIAAELAGIQPRRLAQQHGALPCTDDTIDLVLDIVRELEPDLLGPPLAGEDGVGLQVPDTEAPVGVTWPATITGLDHPRRARCTIHTATGELIARPGVEYRDQETQALIELPAPGLYRIALSIDGAPPTSQLILATS